MHVMARKFDSAEIHTQIQRGTQYVKEQVYKALLTLMFLRFVT